MDIIIEREAKEYIVRKSTDRPITIDVMERPGSS